MNHASHLWSFCLVSIACSSKYGNNTLCSLDLTESMENLLKRVFRMGIVDKYLSTPKIWHFFESSWDSSKILEHLLDDRDIDTLRDQNCNGTENIRDIKFPLQDCLYMYLSHSHLDIKFHTILMLYDIECSYLCRRSKSNREKLIDNNILGEKS